MTKNQINYLLGLATLFILWLFFNSFYIGAKIQNRISQLNVPRPAMAGVVGGEYAGLRPNYGRNQQPVDREALARLRSSFLPRPGETITAMSRTQTVQKAQPVAKAAPVAPATTTEKK